MKQQSKGGRRGRPRLLEERVQISAYLPRELAEEADRLRGAEPWSSWIRGLIEREVARNRL